MFPGTLRALLRTRLPWLAFLPLFVLSLPVDWVTYSLLVRDTGASDWLAQGFLIGTVDSANWAVTGPVALAVAWMLPLDRARWRGAVAATLGVAVLLPVLGRLGMAEVAFRAGWNLPRTSPWDLVRSLPSQALVVAALVGGACGIRLALLHRESTLALSRREAQLAEAWFRAARGRLQPRFLFATLDAVSELMERDARQADRLLVRLSEVLRATFGGMETEEQALHEEVGFALLYLGIEQTCSGTGAVGLRAAVAPPARAARVPRMAVFPLVEQAWREAGDSPVRPGEVEVAARLSGESLHLEVRDTGRASAAERRARPGWRDVQVVNEMLERRFGAGHAWSLADLPAGGVEATLRLPLRSAGEAG
ncbi:MAG: histidine kinase [Gemmatimonadota bacterium]